MVLRFDPNIPTSYWSTRNKSETLIYRKEKMIKLAEKVDRVQSIIKSVSRKDNIEDVNNSVFKKVFDQYVRENSRLSEIYRKES